MEDRVAREWGQERSGCGYRKGNMLWLVPSVVRVSAQAPKGHGFNYWSRAHPWVAGLIPGPDGAMYRRQQIDVSFSHWCFSLFFCHCLSVSVSTFFPPPPLDSP